MSNAYFLNVAGLSDVGQKRNNNEDAYTHCSNPQIMDGHIAGMLVVSDGMGGHAAGEVASNLTTTHWNQYCQELMLQALDKDELESAVKHGVVELHRRVLDYADKNNKMGMGCTFVSALLHNQEVLISNVGDSGAFLCRDSQCESIYTSDNELERLLQQGKITPEMAANSAFKSHLMQAIGYHGEVEPHTCFRRVYNGDRLLLCSDGLTAHVSPHEFAEILSGFPEDREAATYLIKLANQRGGTDNVTVIVATVAGSATAPRKMVFKPQPIKSKNHGESKFSMHWLLAASIILLGVGIGITAGAMKPFRKNQPMTAKTPKPQVSQMESPQATNLPALNEQVISSPETANTQLEQNETAYLEDFGRNKDGYKLELNLNLNTGKYEISAHPPGVLKLLTFKTQQGLTDVPFDRLIIPPEDIKPNTKVLTQLILRVQRTQSNYSLVVEPPREVIINKRSQNVLQNYSFPLNQPANTRMGLYLIRENTRAYPFIITNVFAPFHNTSVQTNQNLDVSKNDRFQKKRGIRGDFSVQFNEPDINSNLELKAGKR
jgi:serine/threonine protein phosphatase PrpC